jgi:hypothetical protein
LSAYNQQRHFPQRMRHPPNVARILNDAEMVEKRAKARLLLENGEDKAHGGGSPNQTAIENHVNRKPLTLLT